jgi:hypothetical protein
MTMALCSSAGVSCDDGKPNEIRGNSERHEVERLA